MNDLTYEYPAEVVMQRARETRAMVEENKRLRKAAGEADLERERADHLHRALVEADAHGKHDRRCAAIQDGPRRLPCSCWRAAIADAIDRYRDIGAMRGTEDAP